MKNRPELTSRILKHVSEELDRMADLAITIKGGPHPDGTAMSLAELSGLIQLLRRDLIEGVLADTDLPF